MKTQVVTARSNGVFPPTVLGHTPTSSTLAPARPSPLSISTTLERPRRPVPGPLDLSSAQGNRAAAPMSTLASARMINDLRVVPYPKTIKAPNLALNIAIMPGKFRYEHEFLMQFMDVCKEKPDSLPPLDAIGLEGGEGGAKYSANPRTGEGRRVGSMGMGIPSLARQASMGLGLGPGLAKRGGFAMGQFQSPSRGGDSQSRFGASNRARGAVPFAGSTDSRLTPITRNTAQGGVGGGGLHEAKRTRVQRGNNRGESGMTGSGVQTLSQQLPSIKFGPVAPLEVDENRSVARIIQRTPQRVMGAQLVERKVRALLSKLTVDKFDSISDQIIAYANRSEQETDGSTLIQVIGLVSDSAKEDARFSAIYARLCRKMMQHVSSDIQDHSLRGLDGRPISGGMLFRKHLLNRCQEDFERGWGLKEASLAVTPPKRNGYNTSELEREGHTETMLYSDEYYAASKAKLQARALVQFMGEMFKLSILTERITHECIKKLLSNVVNLEEGDIESLCKLLTAVGQILDNPKARNHMDIYFERMNEMVQGKNVNYRTQFLLLDVIELRSRQWQARSAMNMPSSISRRQDQGNRNLQLGGSRRGERRDTAELDGRNLFASAGTRPPVRAGDLCQFAKISKSCASQYFPSNVFSGKGPKLDAGLARAGAVSVFATFSRGGGAPVPTPSSRKPSADLGSDEVPPRELKNLNLATRTKLLKSTEVQAWGQGGDQCRRSSIQSESLVDLDDYEF